MRRFFWVLIVLFVSVFLGLQLAKDPGYAIFAYRQWTIEMPLWFAVVCALIGVWVLYFFLRLADTMDFSLYRWKNWLRWRRKYKSYSKTNRGLIELIEGHWRSAETDLVSGIEQSDAPLINYLAAAKAAHEQGAYDRREIYLRKAHHAAPQAEMAIGLTQAALQLDQGQLEQALATLEHLQQTAPKQPSVATLLEKVYVQLADWQGLIKLLPTLRKTQIMAEPEIERLEIKAYQELLRHTAARYEGAAGIQRVYETVPKKIQKKMSLLKCYIQLLLPYPEKAPEIDSFICQGLKKNFDAEFVKWYGTLATGFPKKQLIEAEQWHKRYGDHTELFLTLGRLCVQCQLWGKARSYFEESIKLEKTPEGYFELGCLLEKIGSTEEAGENYKKGLELV